jgi:predicted nucleic acid-binding protein
VNGYLADTNIPSELTRPSPEPQVEEFLERAGREQVYISALSVGEIRKGIASLPPSARRRQIEAWLESVMRPWFATRILPVTVEIAERWGVLAALSKERGRPLAVVDGLLAATALEHDLSLVTRNVRDFDGLGVAILNPWELPEG